MKKVKNMVGICALILFVFAPLVLALPRLFSYFSDIESASGRINTGSLAVNLSAADSGTDEAGLKLNSSVLLDFYLENTGINPADCLITVDYSWQTQLPADEVLYLYPANLSDAQIFEDIAGGGSFALDSAFNAVLDSGEIQNYRLKLFFYNAPSSSIGQYDAQTVLVSVKADADAISLYPAAEGGSTVATGWAITLSHSLTFTAITDITPPVITEIDGAKTFFVTQAGSIDFTAYARAEDDIDGDLTDKIVITSVPEFNPDIAGEYTVTYNVSDIAGNHAEPLSITFTVWDFVKIVGGNYHTLALTSHGRVYSWGFSYYGQLGLGDTNFREIPTLIPSLNNIIDIAAGTGCSYALDAFGQAYSWGQAANGRLGNGSVNASYVPAAVTQNGVKFVSIAARFATVGGVTADGEVYTWGAGRYGALGTGNANDQSFPTKIAVSNIASLDLGYYNGAAVTATGEVYTWGDNLHGQLGNGAAMAVGTNAPAPVPFFSGGVKARQISVGYYHMAAVTDSGEAYTWGQGLEGRLGNNQATDKNTPQLIMTGAQKAIAAYYHTGVLTGGGTAYFFGQNAYGKHGVGGAENHFTPVPVETVTGATDIALNLDTSFILSGGREVYGFGYGGTGILGNGASQDSSTPKKWAFVPPPPS